MLRNRAAVIQICEVLAEQENLKVTVKESTKGAMLTGFGALAGGLLAGPIGLAIGGTVASITAACTSKNYRSVVDILKHDLTSAQKQKLGEAVNEVINNIGPEDYVSLLSLILNSTSLKEAVLKEIGNFLLKEMSLQMVR